MRIPQPRFVLVLGCLLAILILAPIVQQAARPGISRVLGVLGIVVPVLGIAAVGDHGRPRRVALGLAVACALLNADAITRTTGLGPEAGIGVTLLFLAYTTARLLLGVVRSREVTIDVIAGALASYMMIGLTWAMAYGLLETRGTGALRGPADAGAIFDFPTLLYFSYITLLTIGYGDIAPVTATARMLTVIEGLLGMTFTTVILAVLVAGHLARRDAPRR